MQRSLYLAVLFLAGLSAVPAYGGPKDLADEGVGTYSDASVGNQISNFSINRQMVSCGVGTFSTPPGKGGPFAMLMYARDITFYQADHRTKTITARGRMISITHVNGEEVEREEHDFIAIAKDRREPVVQQGNPMEDRFDIHFHTTFWQPGNPLCTPSTEFPGECRFGGDLVTDNEGLRQMGDVTVGHQ
jgi:hypothetical protein